jgi:hypothetical protein
MRRNEEPGRKTEELMGSMSLLRGRDFRLVAGSICTSALGDWVAIIALGLEVQVRTGSGIAVAALWICLFGPSVAVAGHAGLLVDRFETTRLLAAVSALGSWSPERSPSPTAPG